MKRTIRLILLVSFICIFLMTICPINVQATGMSRPSEDSGTGTSTVTDGGLSDKGMIDPDKYNPNKNGIKASDVKVITDLANPIIGTIKTVGIVIAVITLILLGFKYMTGSISEKAEYKKTMIPYLVGAVLVVSITQLIGLIIEIVSSIH